jgi:hypothetical protein
MLNVEQHINGIFKSARTGTRFCSFSMSLSTGTRVPVSFAYLRYPESGPVIVRFASVRSTSTTPQRTDCTLSVRTKTIKIYSSHDYSGLALSDEFIAVSCSHKQTPQGLNRLKTFCDIPVFSPQARRASSIRPH